MSNKRKSTPPAAAGDFDTLVSSIVHIHQQTQDFAAKAVNVALTLRNWLIGYRIVEFEQMGKDRAAYGKSLIDTLAQRLASQRLPRVTPRELRRYRQLYQVYPRIWESLTPKSLAQTGFANLLNLLPPSASPIRESVSLHLQAVETLAPTVREIIGNRSRDARLIEHTLDHLLDHACTPQGLAIFKSLCRHYWEINPQATASYISAYREMWDSDDQETRETEFAGVLPDEKEKQS